MTSRSATFAGVALAAGTLTFGLAPRLAAASGGAAPGVHTIVYTAKYSEGHFAFTGNFKAPELGDRFIDSATLRLDGHRAGTLYRIAELVAGSGGKSQRFENTATYTVAGGQFTTIDESGDVDTEPQALVGGTGIFAGASGTVITHSGKSAGRFVVTYVVNR